MNAAITVARKELRSFYQSPVALIFLGLFQLSTLLVFFGQSRFFARNIADVRPLFEWLPLLLVLLVSAVTMRQWAEERRAGTLEVLLTLPVSTWDLVFGKFLAATALVGTALALTLPLPVMVSVLGPLDWGPVWGGYLGALLLGSTYAAIGLCVSARTDNQVVSLMLTLVVGGALYLVGTDSVTALFGNSGAELLRALGTGSRFASIERGVLDLRDLAYYGGLTAFFLALNWYFLERDRVDEGSTAGARTAASLAGLVGLVLLNAIALDLWMAPLATLRVDMTEGGDYSVSDVTVDTLRALDEPLAIHGYFSERTHPLLAPLVPQIRDLLDEYAIHGGGKVTVDVVDPNTDEEIESEIQERYGIRSVPFRVSDRHEQSVVNSYFALVIAYGDQYQTLGFDDLIEVHADDTAIDVRLKNLEYDLTRTIKRVSQDFQSLDAVLAKLPMQATLTAYVSPATLPEDFAELPETLRTVGRELAARSQGRLAFAEVDPSTDPEVAQRLSDELGVQPLAVDILARQVFYLDLALTMGDRVERVMPRSALPEADLRRALEAAIRRITPGQLTTVGIYTETPEAPPPQPDYQGLQQLFTEDYQLEPVDLEDGAVPDTVDVLLVGKAGPLTEAQRFAIDQYLMRGGKVVALAGAWQLEPSQQGLTAKPQPPALAELLEAWGVHQEPALIMDPQNAPFPIPVQERRGPLVFQRIELIPYPFFPDVREDGLADHPALSGVVNLTAPWASPLTVTPREGVEATVLARSSEESWLQTSGDIDPDFRTWPADGFERGAPAGRQAVAVALSGRFQSFFADRPAPTDGDTTGRTLKESLPDARLVVLGSSEMVSDLMLSLSQQATGEVHRSNLQLVQNLVDWAVEDTDLLTIRSAGAYARTLVPMAEEERRDWEWLQLLLSITLLTLVAWLPQRRRAATQPIPLPRSEEA